MNDPESTGTELPSLNEWADVDQASGEHMTPTGGIETLGADRMDEAHFLHGAEYLSHVEVVRVGMCGTCAFRPGSPVRPADFTTEAFFELCSGLDDFVCHTQGPDGSYPSCAGFHRLHRQE